MTTLVCIRRFGNFLPGDEVPGEFPDDAVFDSYHFAAKPKTKAKGKNAKEDDD